MTGEHRPESLRSATMFPAPLDGEELIFSVSCGKSHLNWATHYGKAEDYDPQLFWRTSHLEEGEVKGRDTADLLSLLSRSLPDGPHDFMFGKAGDASAANALARSQRRTVPRVSVYVVGTNPSQERLLEIVWGAVPSRFFVMRDDDFFRREEGRYDGLDTDRLATLTGAVQLYGHPALVFDGGAVTTYSATDRNGRIMGGGVGPGIYGRGARVERGDGANISAEQVLARITEAREKQKTVPIFSRNSPDAALADSFQEFALKGRNVVEHWIKKAYSKSPSATSAVINTGKRVICTGEESEFLTKLLHPHYGGIVGHLEEARSRNGAVGPRYIVEPHKHLVHYGIACVLAAEASLHRSKEEFRRWPREVHMGRRVAKLVRSGVADRDTIVRGTVMKVVEVGEEGAAFRIKYDSGDQEDVLMDELYNRFKLFSVHGEKKTERAEEAEGMEGAEEAAQPSIKTNPSAKAATKAQTPKAMASQSLPATLTKNTAKEISLGEKEPETQTPTTKTGKTTAHKKEKSEAEKASNVSGGLEMPMKNAANRVPQKEKEEEAEEERTTKEKKTKVLAAEKEATAPSTQTQSSMKHTSSVSTASPARSSKRLSPTRLSRTPKGSLNNSRTPTRSSKRKAVEETLLEKNPEKTPAAKRPRTIESEVNYSNPHSFARRRVAKDFDGDLYFGTVKNYDDSEYPCYWHVEYDDGDEEDYSKRDLIMALKYYQVAGKKDWKK